jgi:hypothetical protein
LKPDIPSYTVNDIRAPPNLPNFDELKLQRDYLFSSIPGSAREDHVFNGIQPMNYFAGSKANKNNGRLPSLWGRILTIRQIFTLDWL